MAEKRFKNSDEAIRSDAVRRAQEYKDHSFNKLDNYEKEDWGAPIRRAFWGLFGY